MNIKVVKKENLSELILENPYINESVAKEIAEIKEVIVSMDEFSKKMVNKYGEEFFSNLIDFDMISNIAYHSLYNLLLNKGYKFLGFNYYKHFNKTPFTSYIINTNL